MSTFAYDGDSYDESGDKDDGDVVIVIAKLRITKSLTIRTAFVGIAQHCYKEP